MESEKKDELFTNNSLFTTKVVQNVPDLLLANVFFINEDHTSYISSGFDVDDGSVKIVLYKNKVFHYLNYMDWYEFLPHFDNVRKHFNGEPVSSTIKVSNKYKFRLSESLGKKYFSISGYSKKVTFTGDDWYRLNELIPYVSKHIVWGYAVSSGIQDYFNNYAKQCLFTKTTNLPQYRFFMSSNPIYYYCNFSKLFDEIPILCKQTLYNNVMYDYDLFE